MRQGCCAFQAKFPVELSPGISNLCSIRSLYMLNRIFSSRPIKRYSTRAISAVDRGTPSNSRYQQRSISPARRTLVDHGRAAPALSDDPVRHVSERNQRTRTGDSLETLDLDQLDDGRVESRGVSLDRASQDSNDMLVRQVSMAFLVL